MRATNVSPYEPWVRVPPQEPPAPWYLLKDGGLLPCTNYKAIRWVVLVMNLVVIRHFGISRRAFCMKSRDLAIETIPEA